MATSAQQTYIAKLGFQDPDRNTNRHGLACEYLLERLIELEVRPSLTSAGLRHEQIEQIIQSRFRADQCLNTPITNRGFVAGFADVLLNFTYSLHSHDLLIAFLGEVKIARQPAEQVLQQINFYRSYPQAAFATTYLLTDYDPCDLTRLCQGTSIKVFRLGDRFEQWIASRIAPQTEEL